MRSAGAGRATASGLRRERSWVPQVSFRYVQRASEGFNGDPSVGDVVSLLAGAPLDTLRFELRSVAITDLMPGLMGTREGRVRELRALLEAGEELAPIIVVGRCTIDGNHRLQAAADAGADHVLAWVLAGAAGERHERE